MRRAELAINLIFLLPVVAGIMIACLLATPLNIFAALTCYAIGLTSLIQAKLSLFRQSVSLSIGPQRLTQEYRRSYWMGYAFIAMGVLINTVALLVIGRIGHTI
ncbi:MAG: hypothetical protein KDB23_24495 [Planctomycetales bacterium]|nr:hypothetical protein [Planctomycetales bacterium]